MIVVLLAVICGLSAMWGMVQIASREPGVVEQEKVPLVMATVNIMRGQMITAEELKIRQWHKDMLPEGAIGSIEEAQDRAATLPILAGEPVIEAKLAAEGTGVGIAPLIPKGMRAYTIMTSKIASSVAGFVLPGNRVDILLNLRGSGRDDVTGGGSTTTLLQAVEILAINQALDAPTENKTDPRDLASVTLIVTPDQAAILDVAQNQGTLTLSLRNPEDMNEADTRPALLADIRYRQESPLNPEPLEGQPAAVKVESERKEIEPMVYPIRTFRGGSQGEVRVVSYQVEADNP
jgi:pilus assembly protein CpaB